MHNLIYLDRHIGQMLYICIVFILYAFETQSCHAYYLETNISIKHTFGPAGIARACLKEQ